MGNRLINCMNIIILNSYAKCFLDKNAVKITLFFENYDAHKIILDSNFCNFLKMCIFAD